MSIILGTHELGCLFLGSSRFEEPKVLRTVSGQMVPRFIYEEYPRFIEFLESFLEFVELKYDIRTDEFKPGPYYILKNLISTVDIDRSAIEYLQFFKRTYARDFPNVTEHEIRSLLKRIRDFYLRKGTVDSFDFFFRSVFASFSEIYLPKVDMLRASDGRWYVEYQIRLKRVDGDLSYLSPTELSEIYDASIVGQTSRSTAWIGFPVQAVIIDSMDTTAYYWSPVISRKGEFTPGETVTVTLPDGRVKSFWIGLVDSLQVQPGRWLTTDGFISDNKKVQDSYYYQDFSYVVKTNSEVSEFANPMVNSIHPAGFRIFAQIEEENPSIIEVYPSDFVFLFYKECIIWIRNWDIITGAAEISEISGYDGEHLGLIIRDGGEGQGFFDWGAFASMKETDDVSFLFENVGDIDEVSLDSISDGDPKSYIFASWIGRKIICSDIDFTGADTNWPLLRVDTAEMGLYHLEADSFPISEVEDYTIGQLERTSIQVLPFSNTSVYHKQILSTELGLDSFTVEDLPHDKMEYLAFIDGRKVPAENVFVSNQTVEGVQRSKIQVVNPHFEGTNRSVCEVLILDEKSLARGVISAWAVSPKPGYEGAINVEIINHEPSYVPESNSPWDFLVFLEGRHLVPGSDYYLSDDGFIISVFNSIWLQFEVATLEIYCLKKNQSSFANVLTLSGITGSRGQPKPAGGMFDRVPGRLDCSQVKDTKAVWFNFDQESFSSSDKAFSEFDSAAATILPTDASLNLGELVPFGAPNGTSTWLIGTSATDEPLFADAETDAILAAMRTVTTDPFTLVFRYKVPTGFTGIGVLGGPNCAVISDWAAKISFSDSSPSLHDLTCDIRDDTGPGTYTLQGNGISNAEFHTVVLVFDGTTAYLYIDSVLVDSIAWAALDLFDLAPSLNIGANLNGTNAAEGCEIELFALFDSDLSLIEIKALHNGGWGLPGPQRYF